MTTTYDELIASKTKRPEAHGFDATEPVNAKLFDWQKLIVRWAVKQGRAALFEDCGLGKTPQELEWAQQVCRHTGKATLILTALAVAEQFVAEGQKFSIPCKHVRQPEDFLPKAINVTNYERLELFEGLLPEVAGVVLDESSILKSFMGKIRHKLTEVFAVTPYRLCGTATPAPNDFTELGQHAEFLGVCSAQEMLATWFINDTANTGTWRLKKHAQDDFWRWVASWAACLSKPSDLGFPDDGFSLPPLNLIPVWVDVDESENRAEGELIRLPGMSATSTHREMRLTAKVRAQAAAELVNASKEPWSIWCNTNYEADEILEVIPDALDVRGSDKAEHKEAALKQFSTGEARVISSKAGIAGYGLNWQHCHNLVCFPSFSFEDFYQLVRRHYRFGQTQPVNCYMVLPRTGSNILHIIKEKLEKHETMHAALRFSAERLLDDQKITIMKTDIETHKGESFTLHHGDCVRVAKTIPPEFVDFSVFSPPFADLFVYSSDVQDMGNNRTLDEFFEQFNFLVKHLYRVTVPGRLCAVHCADLLATKWKDGEIELKNFSGKIVDCFNSHDWLYHCRVTIWKDPVMEMQRTKSLGLLHKQLLKDSAMSRVGSPEYVLIFRKPGKNPKPVAHERDDYPVEKWQQDASPVWLDIRQTRVLNGEVARDNQDERHICPLQLDTIERLLRLYSNPGDLVYSPFAGIGSEGYCAVKARRRFVGSELKRSYFELAVANVRKAEDESRTLFDLEAVS